MATEEEYLELIELIIHESPGAPLGIVTSVQPVAKSHCITLQDIHALWNTVTKRREVKSAIVHPKYRSH
jgi:hypothetical protein